MSLRSSLRGWLGELRCAVAQRLFLDSRIYHAFNDLVIRTAHGSAQVDHVIVSRFGLFVVEAKSRVGWIYGQEMDRNWTHVHFKRKDQFQNPLHQNYGHMKALEELLGIGMEKMHSVVVFTGGCTLKTSLPSNVLAGGYTTYVKAKRDVLLADAEVERIRSVLGSVKSSSGFVERWRHVTSVRERFTNHDVCPKCRGQLVLRVAARGPDVGSTFLGCSNFPRCRFTRNS